jgi:hypothetical protein
LGLTAETERGCGVGSEKIAIEKYFDCVAFWDKIWYYWKCGKFIFSEVMTMDLTYKYPGIEYSVNSIMLFENDPWIDSIFHFYPQIDKAKFDCLSSSCKTKYLHDVLQEHCNKDGAVNEIDKKLIKYNDHWKLHKNQIEAALSDAFQCGVTDILNDMVGNVTFNPICPRFLNIKTFDVFYLNSERGALGISLHELIHFVWFHVWQGYFNDSIEEYETPYLKWVFSEMVVDPIMRKDARLSKINPYFDDGCAYPYFYEMTVNGKPILETLYEMYINLNMLEFMKQGYSYCVKYEAEIRAQMKKNF